MFCDRLKLGLFIILFMILPLSACSSNKAGKDMANQINSDSAVAVGEKTAQTPVEILYREAAKLLNASKYVEAAKKFDEVEREYPYSQWATKAQLMSSYAHYRDLKYDEAIIALDRFIQLHPSDKNIAYAYYLRALCYYEQISDVRRDQKMTKLALENLKQVVKRYPDSKYARDAQLKLDLTKDHLAGKEMEIGRYYLKQKQYQAAVNRFQRVVDDYQTTTHVPEALYRLVEAYLGLGIPVEAKKSAAVLGHNYPKSYWYKEAYKLIKGEDVVNMRGEKKENLYEKTIGRIF